MREKVQCELAFRVAWMVQTQEQRRGQQRERLEGLGADEKAGLHR